VFARLHVKSNRQIIEPQWAEEQIRFLHTLTLAMAESPDFDSALKIVLETVCETQGWDYGEA